jgi:N-ethylmaleimide reductase
MTLDLFSPFKLGSPELKNRLVMAPMTRSRAIGNVPNDLMAEYYAQRSGGGLLITEGTSPSPNGLGYARIPGVFNADQIAGWRKVTDAVHAGGARIFIQIMHTGRVGHPANLPSGAEILGPSAIAVSGEMWTDASGALPHPTPRQMTQVDIDRAIQEYVRAAQNAIEAGFDGVELHGANGYLIDQFLNPASNQRSDEYGGAWKKRNRFATEVARAVASAIGKDRTGIRLSPSGVFNDMANHEDTTPQFADLAKDLSDIGLVYLHLVDHSSMGAPKPEAALVKRIRETFKGAFVLSGGYDLARANADLAAGDGDLVAFGKPFLANPDLAERLKSGAALNPMDPATLYTPGAKGYTDYPSLATTGSVA